MKFDKWNGWNLNPFGRVSTPLTHLERNSPNFQLRSENNWLFGGLNKGPYHPGFLGHDYILMIYYPDMRQAIPFGTNQDGIANYNSPGSQPPYKKFWFGNQPIKNVGLTSRDSKAAAVLPLPNHAPPEHQHLGSKR